MNRPQRNLSALILSIAVVTGVAAGIITSPAASAAPQSSLPAQKSGDWEQLKYTWTTPASGNDYTGTVVGNGHIGARVAGAVASDTLQLNDKTFWSGEPTDVSDPARRDALAQTRDLLAQADSATTTTGRESLLKQAESAAEGMWARPSYDSRYLPLGKLMIDVPGTSGYSDYSRVLDLDSATVTTKYTVGGVTYTREVFASHPDNVIIVNITNDKSTPMTITARMTAPSQMAGHSSVTASGNEISMTGTAPYTGPKDNWAAGRGTTFDARVRIKTVGGSVSPSGQNLLVTNAKQIVLVYSSATSYKDPFTLPNPAQGGNDPAPIVDDTLDAATAKLVADLRSRHIANYRSLFRRLWLDVNGNAGTGAGNVKTYQYSRYEMISVSQDEDTDRPRNQQGMWNPDWNPENDSSHFLNENVEKHYSSIETANLSELGEPLWKWTENLAVNGRVSAEKDWGFNGWTAPHFSDIWASTAIASGNNEWAVWPVGGLWLTTMMYDHYEFTQNRSFLADRAFPVMKGAAEFALDLLVEDGHGKLETSPSTSAENRYRLSDGTKLAIARGATGDMAMIRQLFHDVIEAADILQVTDPADAALVQRVVDANARLIPIPIGASGEIKEWNNSYVSADPSHRHATHLIGVNMRDVITTRSTPQLFDAAKKALEMRGSGGYMPDKSLMWARLGQGDKAVVAHKLYQEDAGRNKYGTISGYIPELFVQSHAGEIDLLPAVPSGWGNGTISGVKARGGYELSITWANGELVSAQIHSSTGATPTVRYAGSLLDLDADSRVTLVGATETNSVILDDSDATTTGSWASSTLYPGFYGLGYRSNSSGTGEDSIRWTPNLSHSGKYRVYASLPDGVSNRASNAAFKVKNRDGINTVLVDERRNPSMGFALLGTFEFDAGTGGYVELSDSANGAFVIADAVKFEYVG